MKTAVYTAYGSPETICFADRPIPQPGPGQVLVRVHAAPVTAGDVRLRSGKAPRGMGKLLRLVMGWSRPRIAPGWGFAGEVVGLGAGVVNLTIGQRVFGLMGVKGGSHAEYLVVRADGAVLPMPPTLDYSQGAAFFFGGLTAQHYLITRAGIKSTERVLIHGASGAVGSAAVQIAAHLGAEVTAACSVPNHALVRSLGALTTHDYRDGPAPGRFDVILDVMGSLGWGGAKAMLAPGGRLCLITADLLATLGAELHPHRQGHRVIAGASSESRAAMQALVTLHEAGGYLPVIGQTLPFDALHRAHAIAESFHKPGNLVVTF